MELLSRQEQQAFVYNRLSPDLAVMVKGSIARDAALQDVFKVITTIFEDQHPLFQRRAGLVSSGKEKFVSKTTLFPLETTIS